MAVDPFQANADRRRPTRARAATNVVAGFVLILLAIASLPSAWADANDDLEKVISGNWLVKVAGDKRTRTLKIFGLDGRSNEGFFLDAVYGWSTDRKVAIDAEIVQRDGKLTLTFNTPVESKVILVLGADGIFVGSLAPMKGGALGATAAKISDDELESVEKAELNEIPKFEQPSADVPASCAPFVGGWTGMASDTRVWLWVTSVNSSCVATYFHGASTLIPDASAFKTAAIRNGVLEQKRDKDTVTFEIRGDKVLRKRIESGKEHSFYMEKVPTTDDALARLRVQQRVAIPTPFPPGAEVPAICAAFFGKWVGKWSRGNGGEHWLRVFRVAADCTADIGYTRAGFVPKYSLKAKIKEGYLTFPWNAGECSFSRKGDTLSADYNNRRNNPNSGVFRKVE